MVEIDWAVPWFLMVFMSAFTGFTDAFLARHLQPGAIPSSELDREGFHGSAAAMSALLSLSGMGAEDVQVVSVRRLEAPFPGYVVDATGLLFIQGAEYSVFRLVFSQGAGDPDGRAVQLAFLAGGRDEEGHPHIYPPFAEDGGFVPEHEFLEDMDDFLAPLQE